MTTATITSDLSALSDEDLTKATDRAYREAARCWQEYRAEPNGSPIKRMLLTSAEAADQWFEQLRDEQAERIVADEPVEVSSADTYVTSPWVRNAARQELPYRVEGGNSRDGLAE